jgi:hypothetical protein
MMNVKNRKDTGGKLYQKEEGKKNKNRLACINSRFVISGISTPWPGSQRAVMETSMNLRSSNEDEARH